MAAGVGHSTQQMSREAGREAATVALEAARARHGGDLPPLTLVVVYATVLHDQAHVLDGVRSVLGEEAPLVGCSTQGISVRCGVHEVDRVVGCAVLAEPGIQAKPVRVEGLGADSRAAGRAVAAALGGPSDLPVLLWYDALTVNSTELLHGLAEGGVRWAIGGAAGQPFGQVHKTFQYLGGSVSEDSVVALALSGDVEMLYDQTHGAEPLGLELEVTASTQNVLGEVDGMPALDFLIDQLGIGDDELNIESASVWAIGVQPEAPADGDERGRLYEGPLTRAFFGWDLEQRTLSMQAEIPVGTRIQLCHRSHEAVLQGAVDMARRLNARVKGEPLLALGFECAARPRPFLGDDGAQEEICTMQAEMVEMPWLGFYAWGEIAPAGAGTESHNYTFPLVLLTRPSPRFLTVDRATLKKLQLLVKREHEILKLRGRLRAHGTWMQRVERITGAMATAPTVESAIGTLATELLCESPYEIAWVHSRTGYQDLFGGSLTDAELEEVERTSQRWWDPAASVQVVDIPPHAPSGRMWLLGGNVLSEHGVEAVVVVGRTSRTAGYYVPPWDGDVTHLGHLLHTARHVLSAVAQRVGLNDQVLEATKRLRVALDEANQANRAKSVFLANMSHELRTPLNAIIGYAELVAGDAEDQGLTDMMEDLGRIRTAGHLLLGLISDILDLSKIEAGRVEVELSDFDLRTVIDSVATTLRPLVEERGNTLELDLDPTVGQVHLDERKVRQVLTNLLGNASKFTTEGSIRVRSRACEDDVCIEVSDTGVGMPEDVLDRIFDPFYQVRQSDQGAGPGGTGLGLAISHRFCRMLGGDLTVQSALGRGSTFVVRVPSGRG